jgi:hypothetical protein
MVKNWTEIIKKYKGQWVALAEDETTVVAASKDAKEAYAKAQKKGVKVPIMFSVPLEIKPHIGGTN